MKIKRSLAALGVLVVVATAEAQAQMVFEVTPFTGGTFFLSDPPNRFALGRRAGAPLVLQESSFDHAWTLGVHTGVRFDERWALEGMFSWIPTSISASSGLPAAADVNGFMYGLTGLFYLPVEGRVVPFLGLGVGAETFDYDIEGVENETEWMGNVAAGLHIELGEKLGLRLEARDCFARFHSGVSGIANGWENDLMTTVGLSFKFPRS